MESCELFYFFKFIKKQPNFEQNCWDYPTGEYILTIVLESQNGHLRDFFSSKRERVVKQC